MHIVDGIHTRNTINKQTNKKRYRLLLWGASLCWRLREGKTNACIQSIYRATNGALRYSNEMRCFGMHGDMLGVLGLKRRERKKKKNIYLLDLSLGVLYNKHEGADPQY